MSKRPYSEARKRANRKYDEKTYAYIMLRLRKEDDKDILEAFASAKERGISHRELLRSLFEKE